MTPVSKTDAQARVDRIISFRVELDLLERENVVCLSDEQHKALENYHDGVVKKFKELFDVDTGEGEKKLSLGMKIASFAGALCLAASLFFLFYRFWGRMATAAQVSVLILAPVLTLALTWSVSKKEKSGYYAKIAAMVAFAAFVLNISMMGRIFNTAPSDTAFLAWAVFAFFLAYMTDARLLLASGILCLAGFLAARAGTFCGLYWLYFGQRPENFFPGVVVLFSLSFVPQKSRSGFSETYRVFSLLFLFISILILSQWGGVSYLSWDNDAVEVIYQIAGFALSAASIAFGVKRNMPEMVNTGNVFFTVFLYTKFFDWWWDWMPKYLFFLVLALAAILILTVFKRLRKGLFDSSETGKEAA
jgi:hypothetical protein